MVQQARIQTGLPAIFVDLRGRQSAANLPAFYWLLRTVEVLYAQVEQLRVQFDTRAEAALFRETLWGRPGRFLAHRLAEEAAPSCAPICLSWRDVESPASSCLPLVVWSSTPEGRILGDPRAILDYIPTLPEGQRAARRRYACYRAQGYHMEICSIERLLTCESEEVC